jgi:hypothetical protein
MLNALSIMSQNIQYPAYEYVGHGLGEQVCAGPSSSIISSSE